MSSVSGEATELIVNWIGKRISNDYRAFEVDCYSSEQLPASGI